MSSHTRPVFMESTDDGTYVRPSRTRVSRSTMRTRPYGGRAPPPPRRPSYRAHPGRVIVYCARARACTHPRMPQTTLILSVPIDMTMGEFAYIFRRRLRIESTDVVFFFVGEAEALVPFSMTLGEVARIHADVATHEVVVAYSGENCFGHAAEPQLNGDVRHAGNGVQYPRA